MTENANVVVVTVDPDTNSYEAGLEAIETLEAGEPVDRPATVRFPSEAHLGEVFNERTYTLLRIVRDEQPSSIRETARMVGRDKKNVYEELTTLEALGVIRFDADGQAKRPVFPYDDLVISPLAHEPNDGEPAVP